MFLLSNFRKRKHTAYLGINTCNATQSPLETVTDPHDVPMYWFHIGPGVEGLQQGSGKTLLIPGCSKCL